jgi:uncharacterized protein
MRIAMAPRLSLLAAWLALAAAPAGASGETPGPAMGNYVFGLFRKGPTWSAARTPASDSLQREHLSHLGRMWADGILLGAGPFLDDGELRGILIFRDDSLAALRAAASGDPTMVSGRLSLELHAWHAPAGIGDHYREIAARPDHRDSMITTTLVFLAKGPKWTDDPSPAMEKIQSAHVQHIFAALASGELATGGPFEDEDRDGRIGVLVFFGDAAAARRFAKQDPAVQAGRLKFEIHPWMVADGVLPRGARGTH